VAALMGGTLLALRRSSRRSQGRFSFRCDLDLVIDAYEAHMVRADGTPVTVYVNKEFDVVSVESGMPGRPGRAPQSSSGASA
jgi:hypothetical protein